MNYLCWIIGGVLSVVFAILAWRKHDAIDLKMDNKHDMLIVLASVVITVVLFGMATQKDYLYIDIIRQIIAYTLLLSVSMIDAKYHIIPNKIIVTAFISGVVLLGAYYLIYPELSMKNTIDCLFGALVGFGMLFVVSIISKQGIGMGDVKLIGSLGLILGMINCYSVLFYALVVLVIYALVNWIRKKINMKSQIPFAPFVYFGYVVCFFLSNLLVL